MQTPNYYTHTHTHTHTQTITKQATACDPRPTVHWLSSTHQILSGEGKTASERPYSPGIPVELRQDEGMGISRPREVEEAGVFY